MPPLPKNLHKAGRNCLQGKAAQKEGLTLISSLFISVLQWNTMTTHDDGAGLILHSWWAMPFELPPNSDPCGWLYSHNQIVVPFRLGATCLAAQAGQPLGWATESGSPNLKKSEQGPKVGNVGRGRVRSGKKVRKHGNRRNMKEHEGSLEDVSSHPLSSAHIFTTSIQGVFVGRWRWCCVCAWVSLLLMIMIFIDLVISAENAAYWSYIFVPALVQYRYANI